MSERIRKTAGCLLILATLAILLAGILPFPERVRTTVFSRNINEPVFSSLPHLDISDLFNCGSSTELKNLPGIGETISSLIIEEREENGPFFYAEDIMSVRGIGPARLEILRPFMLTKSGESGE